jgi:hypothetical protein
MPLLLNDLENASLFTVLSKRIPQGRSGPPIHSENFHTVPCCSVEKPKDRLDISNDPINSESIF